MDFRTSSSLPPLPSPLFSPYLHSSPFRRPPFLLYPSTPHFVSLDTALRIPLSYALCILYSLPILYLRLRTRLPGGPALDRARCEDASSNALGAFEGARLATLRLRTR